MTIIRGGRRSSNLGGGGGGTFEFSFTQLSWRRFAPLRLHPPTSEKYILGWQYSEKRKIPFIS